MPIFFVENTVTFDRQYLIDDYLCNLSRVDYFIDCNLSEVQAIGIGIRVAGKDYNSVHGVVVGEDLRHAYQSFQMFVRSRPWTG